MLTHVDPQRVNPVLQVHTPDKQDEFIGQTLEHEPQSVEAKGRSAFLRISILGAKMEPIGPATALW